MSEQPLGNDEAARSTTGEILNQTAPTTTPTDTPTTTETPPTTPSTQTTDPTKPTDAKAPTLANPDPAKPTDGKPTDQTKPAAPEAYTAFKAPDGYTLDPKAIEAVAPIFKELGLTQDQAQKLVDAQIARDIATAKGPQETYANLRKDWQTQTLNHPEIKGARSGEHNGIDAVKAEMGKALNAIGDPALATEFKAAMDLTGAGDHPAFVRTFLKLASFVTEGTHVSGRGPSPLGQSDPSKPARPTPAQSMYPNLPSSAAG
jgi:hypothetical protein